MIGILDPFRRVRGDARRGSHPWLPIQAFRRVACLGGVLAWGAAIPAAAQDAPRSCANGRISQLFIDNHSVFDLSDPDLSPRFTWAYRMANKFHRATREDVIRREILFSEGDCYDVERLRESERLLRALGFIATVDIFGVRQADSTVHVIIDTRDEWSLGIEPDVNRGGGSGLTGLRLREDNALGRGVRVSAFYYDRPETQVYGGAYYTPQLGKTRWDGAFEAGKTPVGYLLSEAITYPFVGETGRWSFRQAITRNDRYFEYRVTDGDAITRVRLPEARLSFDLGGVYRWGPERYRHTMMGVAVRGEWLSYPGEAEYSSVGVRRSAPPPVLGVDLDSISSVRAMLLLGQRNVSFVRRRGLDTVRGTEDVRLGVESQLALGASVPLLSKDRDFGVGFGLFAAAEFSTIGMAGTNLVVEARRNYERPATEPEWSDLFGHLSAWSYLRQGPEARDLLVASVAAVGG